MFKSQSHLYLSFIGTTSGAHSCWTMPKKIREKYLNKKKGGDVVHSPGNTIVKNGKQSATFANKSK